MVPSAAERITRRIAHLGDWRGAALARVRALVLPAAAFQELLRAAIARNAAGVAKKAR